MENKNIKDYLLLVMLIAVVILSILNFKGCSTGNIDTKPIDSITYKIDTFITRTKDTIKIKGKDKLRVDTIFVVDTVELNKLEKDTSELKLKFNSTFPRKLSDTTNTGVGYSQISGAILSDYKFIRDSSKLYITESQLSVCTTSLSSVKMSVDTLQDISKTIAKKAYKKGYDEGSKYDFWKISTIGGVVLGVGILLGVGVSK